MFVEDICEVDTILGIDWPENICCPIRNNQHSLAWVQKTMLVCVNHQFYWWTHKVEVLIPLLLKRIDSTSVWSGMERVEF